MKGKQLVVLIVAALLLAGLAIWSSRKEARRGAPAQVGNKLLPELEAKMNDVNAIVVRSVTETTTVARVDGTWRVTDKFNYPADFTKIRELLTRLADLKILQSMRASPALLADLQLSATAVAEPGAQTLSLEFRDKDGKALATLRAGKPHVRSAPGGEEAGPGGGGYPDGRFVATGTDRILVVGDPLSELTASDKNWLDAELVNVAATDLTRIDVTGATSGVVRLDRPGTSPDWTLKDIPAGKEADTSKLPRVSSALSFLRFEDIADPKLTPEQTGLDKPVTFVGRTAKGEVFTVHVGKSPQGDTRRYAAVSVAFEPPTAPTPAPTDTNAVALAKTQAEEQAKTAARVKQLSEKLGSWVYLLNSYQAEALCMGHDDLVKPKQQEKTETTETKAEKTETP